MAWKATISLRGMTAVKQTYKTVKCFAVNVTEEKADCKRKVPDDEIRNRQKGVMSSEHECCLFYFNRLF